MRKSYLEQLVASSIVFLQNAKKKTPPNLLSDETLPTKTLIYLFLYPIFNALDMWAWWGSGLRLLTEYIYGPSRFKLYKIF